MTSPKIKNLIDLANDEFNNKTKKLEIEFNNILDAANTNLQALDNDSSYLLSEINYDKSKTKTYEKLFSVRNELWRAHTDLRKMILDIGLSSKGNPKSNEISIPDSYQILKDQIDKAIDLTLVDKRNNPFTEMRIRKTHLREFFNELDLLLKKEEDFEDLEIIFYNNSDYALAKQAMSKIREQLNKLGSAYVEGRLNKAEFKQQAHECIHDQNARAILDTHRSPKIADFIAILKNILSVLALFIPIIINNGFFTKAPTNSSEILDKFDNKIAGLVL
jgi:hypothetical protein